MKIMKNKIDKDMVLFIFDWLNIQDQKLIGEKLVGFFIKHRNDDKSLPFFSKIISRMNVDDFSYSLQYLMIEHRKVSAPLSREDKLAMTLSILNNIKYHEDVDFDEYRERLIHIVSGMEQWEFEHSND